MKRLLMLRYRGTVLESVDMNWHHEMYMLGANMSEHDTSEPQTLLDKVYQRLHELDDARQQRVSEEILQEYDAAPRIQFVEHSTEHQSPTDTPQPEQESIGPKLQGIDAYLSGIASRSNTPPHYKISQSSDLYDLFLATYTRDLVLSHLEMTCIEYLLRCRKKGQYVDDVKKVKVIVDRMIKILESADTVIEESRRYMEITLQLENVDLSEIIKQAVREKGASFVLNLIDMYTIKSYIAQYSTLAIKTEDR